MSDSGNEQLAQALRDAEQEGEFCAPARLIAVIGEFETPLMALQDTDQANQLFDAFHQKFGFIRWSFAKEKQPVNSPFVRPMDFPRYASLLRWLIKEIRAWQLESDSNFAKLTALLVAAQVCDFGKALWSLLPDDIENPNLIKYFSQLVASLDFSFSARGLQKPPIWESEAVESFLKADNEGDWVNIISFWSKFPPFFANALQTEAVRYLDRYARNELMTIVGDIRKTPVAMLVASVLSAEQSLRIGMAISSPYFELAAIYRSLHDERHSRRELSPQEAGLLTDMLVKVSRDVPRWVAWMKVFVREPALQDSLGKALVQASSAALKGYVSAMWLYPKQPGPDPIGVKVSPSWIDSDAFVEAHGGVGRALVGAGASDGWWAAG